MKNLVFICLLLSLLSGCVRISNHDREHEQAKLHDLPQIKDSGELVALTLYGSTSYFLYRGEPMGYQYELCEQFANSLGLKLRMEVAGSPDELVQKLLRGEGDLIAYHLAITNDRKDSLCYCGEEYITYQVVVQRRGKSALKDVTELIGKDIYVKPGKHLNRLINLDKELGGGILIHEVAEDSITTEDLITKVAQGEIDYTVCDNDMARLNRTYYPNLNVSLQISFLQRSSWAVRPNTPLLAEAANQWYKANVRSTTYQASAKRYFETSKQMTHSYILSVKDGKISPYDELFKQYAQEIGWDWKLMASLAYTESNFDTAAVSWAGAKGLMQLMPRTARIMGIPEGKEQNPEENIKAAAKYISMMEKSFNSVQDAEERALFVLAAYNAGIGHVKDAVALAKKYGADPNKWDNNVEKYIQLKSNEEYFNDPVCKNGYFRGKETCSFVKEIIDRYRIYQQKIKQ